MSLFNLFIEISADLLWYLEVPALWTSLPLYIHKIFFFLKTKCFFLVFHSPSECNNKQIWQRKSKSHWIIIFMSISTVICIMFLNSYYKAKM